MDNPNLPRTGPASASVAATRDGSYVDWSAVFCGAVVATALSFTLLTFGAAMGLSTASFDPGEGLSLKWMAIASGIWFLWVVLTAMGAGAYLAGRMRRPVEDAAPHEVETRDGIHGLMVWAVAILFGTVMAASGLGSLAGAGSSAIGSTAEVATEAVSGNLDRIGSRLVQGVDQDEIEAIRDEATAILQATLADGEFTAEDRQYLVSRLSEATGVSPDEIGTRIDEAQAQAQELYDEAIAAAEQARFAAAIAAFVVAATLIVGAGVAWFGATGGGSHRDSGRPFSTLFQ